MPIIAFPSPNKIKPLYWQTHIKFFIDTFTYAGYVVQIKEHLKVIDNTFEVEYKGKIFLFDFGDASASVHTPQYPTVFKSHFVAGQTHDNVKSWSPISFYNWDSYKKISNEIVYDSKNNTVMNNQRAYANALERREMVRKILLENLKTDLDYVITDQTTWFKKFSTCLTYVHVPGHHNNMIDRGTMQAMFFGVPIITTSIPEILPYGRTFTPNEHYTVVKDDYSDLIEKIEWCKVNRERCKRIGDNVKRYCQENFMPAKLAEWFERNI